MGCQIKKFWNIPKLDDTVSHITSQTFRQMLPGFLQGWFVKNTTARVRSYKSFEQNVAGDCGSEKHPPFFGGAPTKCSEAKITVVHHFTNFCSPMDAFKTFYSCLSNCLPKALVVLGRFWWEGWSWLSLSRKCFFYMTICSHVQGRYISARDI